jgi:hypothetical protein
MDRMGLDQSKNGLSTIAIIRNSYDIDVIWVFRNTNNSTASVDTSITAIIRSITDSLVFKSHTQNQSPNPGIT